MIKYTKTSKKCRKKTKKLEKDLDSLNLQASYLQDDLLSDDYVGSYGDVLINFEYMKFKIKEKEIQIKFLQRALGLINK